MNLHPKTLAAYHLMHNGILALGRAEQAGIRVDVEYVERKKERLTKKIARLEDNFKQSNFFKHWQHTVKGTINIYSNAQLSYYLYSVKNVKVVKETASGQGSTDEDALTQLNIPELNDLLEIRKLKKVRDTYLDAFLREQVDGWIHASFNLHLVRTYRSSGDSPNLQNIPIRDEESMQICRRALFPRVGNQLLEADFSGLEVRIAACVVGDTKIETIDGPQTILDIIDKIYNNESVYVYGYNFEKQRIGVSRVTNGGLTGEKVEIWKVILDTGEEIKATKDHKFLLRNGKYVELSNLKKNDSLMPFYKKNVKKHWGTVYEKIYLNNGKSILAHNLIAEDVRGITIKGSNKIVHHKYGNGCDNSLNNTTIITRKEHMRIHSVQGWENKPAKDRVFWTQSDEGKAFAKELNKKRNETWTQKDWEEFGFRISESIKRRGGYSGNKNPMFGKTHTDKTKLKISKSKIGKHFGPSWNKGLTKETDERVNKISKSNKGKVAYNKGVCGIYHTSNETKEKISLKMKGRIFSDDSKQKLSKNKLLFWSNKKNKGKNEICKICNKKFYTITNTHLHNAHNVSLQEYKETYNHKVVSIEFAGYEDVYNINVDEIHNYALSSGVIVKNCYHKDPTMLKYINDPSSDMHADMAKQIFKLTKFDKKIPAHYTMRQAAKNGFVFPEFYGDYYKNCAVGICEWMKLPQTRWSAGQGIAMPEGTVADHMIAKGIPSFVKFEKHLQAIETDFWNVRFPDYQRWKERWWQEYQRNGFVDMYTGFRCSGLMSRNDCINYPVQGAAFHCLLWSFTRVDEIARREGWQTRLIGQIHDSMLLDVFPPELPHVVETIRNVTCVELPAKWEWIVVPLTIDMDVCPVDEPWSEKAKLVLT